MPQLKTKTQPAQGLKPVRQAVADAMSSTALQVEKAQGTAALARMERQAEVVERVRATFEATGREIDAPKIERIAGALIQYGGPDLDPDQTYRGLAAYFDHVGTGLVIEYREALAELTDPQLVIDRLRSKAERRMERAGAHAQDAEEYEATAAKCRRYGNDASAEIHLGTAAASHRCAQRLVAEALALKAKADALELQSSKAA